MPPVEALARHADKLYQAAANVLTRQMNLPADSPAVAVYVPGRIEFLGKHTDYAGGRSLLLAVDRGFRLVAVPRAGQDPARAPPPAKSSSSSTARRRRTRRATG